MSSLVEFTVDADQFQLGRVFAPVSGVRVEIVNLVPVDTELVPYLWVSGDDETLAEAADRLAAADVVRDSILMSEHAGRRLYRVEWTADIDGLFDCVPAHDVAVYRAVGTDDRWGFTVFSSSAESLQAFHGALAAHGVPITVQRTHNPVDVAPDPLVELTQKQREALRVAFERGYFEVPQRTTLGEIADGIGVSRQAVSNRLTRAFATLVETVVVDATGE
jgi:predicted DNA binding protein